MDVGNGRVRGCGKVIRRKVKRERERKERELGKKVGRGVGREMRLTWQNALEEKLKGKWNEWEEGKREVEERREVRKFREEVGIERRKLKWKVKMGRTAERAKRRDGK